MVPREILNYATSSRSAHLLNDFGVPIQMLQRSCDRVDIPWFHDHSLNAIALWRSLPIATEKRAPLLD
jgi:hypothetical protein